MEGKVELVEVELEYDFRVDTYGGRKMCSCPVCGMYMIEKTSCGGCGSEYYEGEKKAFVNKAIYDSWSCSEKSIENILKYRRGICISGSVNEVSYAMKQYLSETRE